MYCLIDINNFFVSCERLFRPDLARTPVLVLSSNDGCVIARSSEVKLLDIPMGTPFFKIKELVRTHKIACFSSNFSLYADLSRRFQQCIGSEFPMEIYSIDEVFLKLPTSMPRIEDFAHSLRQRLLQEVGMPTSLGFGPTKTLAKLALLCTKQNLTLRNVCGLTCPDETRKILQKTPASKVWGIGKALSSKLSTLGITSAYDLAITSPGWIRHHFSITLERTARELMGEESIPLEETPEPRKSLQVSRSFGKPVRDLRTLHSAFSTFCENASSKLRRADLFAQGCCLSTTYTLGPSSRIPFTQTLKFTTPLQDPRLIMDKISQHLTTLFLHLEKRSLTPLSPPSFYKGSLIFFPLSPPSAQPSLFDQKISVDCSKIGLFQAIDKTHQKFGSQCLRLASSLGTSWKPKSTLQSPGYTTSWKDLPTVHAIP